jgi:hypothetical protein
MIISYRIEHPNGSGIIEVELKADLDPKSMLFPDQLEDEILGYIENDLFMNISIKDFHYEE